MSLAAETREAVRDRPFLLDALRAGLVNYSATATWLVDVAALDGDPDAIATALRRFREELPSYSTEDRTATVSMRSGVGLVDRSEAARIDADEDDMDRTDRDEGPLLCVGNAAITRGGRDTAVLATGDVDAGVLAELLERLIAVDVDPLAAGVAGESVVVLVSRRDGATAVRVIEATLDAVPSDDSDA